MIAFSCPHCGVQLQAKEHMAGKTASCPGCSGAVQTPAVGTSSGSGSGSGSGQRSASRSAKQQTLPPSSTANGTNSPELKLAPPPECPFLAPPEGPDELGRLGHYLVRKILGTGAMGIVFEAQDSHLKRLVALKVMKPSMAALADYHRRFLREAQLAAAIEHEHVVTVYQVGEDRGIPFLAMKLLQGEALEDRLRRGGGRLPPAEVLRIGREVAEGLAAAHEKGLIHRDIKPANIWLEKDRDRVKIIDFGLARGSEADAHFTQAGAVIGTPSYMAPEQANGKEVDVRCDLFSLGAVLYRACTGRLPFDGKDTLAVLTALATKTPPPPNKIVAGVPQAFSDLVMRLLAKDRNNRPPSAREIVESIESIERGNMAEPEPASPPQQPAPPAARPRTKKEEPVVDVLEEVEETRPKKTRPRSARCKKPIESETNWGQIILVTSLVLLGVAIVVLLVGFIRYSRKGRATALDAPPAIRLLTSQPSQLAPCTDPARTPQPSLCV
ncbi:MAG: serine/threonine-protein kinase [Gemmataceae bacterium]